MKLFLSYIFLTYISIFLTRAEGTKELRPLSSDWGNIEINDQGRPFAKVGCDSLHKLYIHIKSTSETIYFGFQPNDKTDGTGKYQIVDPQGNIVLPLTNVPVVSGAAGYIDSYEEACVGPKIGGFPTNGYTPLSYTPTSTGDYYIEFTTSLSSTYHFDLFDITVVDASNTPILGRLWSHAWDLSARGGTNRMQTIFYIYTSDQYISAVNLNGIQPYGFVISSNSTGTSNTGNLFYDRQSVQGNSTYPEFKLFLNLPDTSVYKIAEPPTMIEDLRVLGTPTAQQDVLFYLNMNKAGTIEIFLDLDDTPGYQPYGKDVVLVKNIKAGGDTIVWNAKDGQLAWVENSVTVDVSSRFSTGVTHLPLYDPEYHTNGFIVNRILPETSRAYLYWDDSRIPSLLGTVEFEGVNGDLNGHNFPDTTGGFGNERTINTWWNGFENNDLKSFFFSMNELHLPVELAVFELENKGDYVKIQWITMSETDNHFFEIERSKDGIHWEIISTVFGAGTTSKQQKYSEFDDFPLPNISYYRLKQTDYNGSSNYSAIASINRNTKNMSCTYIPHNKTEESITLFEQCNISKIQIFCSNGTNVSSCVHFSQINNQEIKIYTHSLASGMYFIKTPTKKSVFFKY